MFTHANNSLSFIVLQSIPHPSPLPPNQCTPLADPAVRVGLLTDLRGFNPLHPKISMHILHTVLFTFSDVPRRRICLRVMTLISDSGLILQGETPSSFHLLHLQLLVFSPNLSTTSGGKSLVAKALLMMLENSCFQKNKMTENTCIQRCQVEGKQNKLSSSILQEISVDYKQHVPLDSKDLNTNSLYCLPDIFYHSSSEKLVSNPTILPNRRFFFFSVFSSTFRLAVW